MKRVDFHDEHAGRLRVLWICFLLLALVFVARIFWLQVIQHGFYTALAEGQHDLFHNLFPERGEIVITDRSGKIFPLATNQDLYLLFAEPRRVQDATATAHALAGLLGIPEDELLTHLTKSDDPYEPLQHGLSYDLKEQIEALKLLGIGLRPEKARYYPESGLGGQMIGFVGSDAGGTLAGRYGLEAFFEGELAGSPGTIAGSRDVRGAWIPVGGGAVNPARNGATLVLTIDRSIQFVACDRLRKAVAKHGADGGSVVIMDPKDGAILAMCGSPDFDPNNFREEKNASVFLNPTVNSQYEPGSIMKPITMAGALETGAVTPDTTYRDTGSVQFGSSVIKNSDKKSHGVQTMTQVLEASLNTGAVFAMRATGLDQFKKNLYAFGFGSKTGIELPSEASGDVRALQERGEIYAATAAFGQGIATTPLQMARAYAAIAHDGLLPHPYLVKEIRTADGKIIPHPQAPPIRVISEKTATVLGGMLASVVERGHGKRAKVPGYYVAGKTGTAQIPKPGGGYYEDRTIGSFVGYAPLQDPRFVMITRVDNPKDVKFAESSAAPLFGEIAAFLLQYLEVKPTITK